MKTKLALVQGPPGGLVIKVANTINELLTLEFAYDINFYHPRIHQVSGECLRDTTGAALVHEVEQQTSVGDYRKLRLS